MVNDHHTDERKKSLEESPHPRSWSVCGLNSYRTPISSIVSHSWKTLNIFVFSTTVHKNSLFSFLPYLDIRSQQTNIFYQRDQLFTMTRIKILLPHLSPLAANNDLMAIIKKSSDYPLPHPPWRQITTSSR